MPVAFEAPGRIPQNKPAETSVRDDHIAAIAEDIDGKRAFPAQPQSQGERLRALGLGEQVRRAPYTEARVTAQIDIAANLHIRQVLQPPFE